MSRDMTPAFTPLKADVDLIWCKRDESNKIVFRVAGRKFYFGTRIHNGGGVH